MALILIRGGGDLASGVAIRLHRVGLLVAITELPQPLAVRRRVSFSEAVFDGQITIEGVKGRLVKPEQLQRTYKRNEINVIIDPEAKVMKILPNNSVLVDARMLKAPPQSLYVKPAFHVGLGPGFTAGLDCDVVIETRRGHTLGRPNWTGSVMPDSGQPEGDARRVLRSPASGLFIGLREIGDHCEEGEIIAEIQDESAKNHPTHIIAPIKGVLRGLLRSGLRVPVGMKIGDIDPRDDESMCYLVSDKSLAVGGGVLEAILSRREIRKLVWD